MSINILKKLRNEIKSKENTPSNIHPIDATASVKDLTLDDRDSSTAGFVETRIKFNLIERQICFNDLPCIGSIPSIYYIPDIINIDEEQQILSAINNEGVKDKNLWKVLKTRRLQLWEDNHTSTSSSVTNSTEGFPQWLHDIIQHLLLNTGIFDSDMSMRPNHVLINDYAIGEGILHHTDGPNYYPHVAILSLNSPCIMTFRKRLDSTAIGTDFSGDFFSVVLKPRSLLVFTDEVYTDYMHGIICDVDHDVVGKRIDGECNARSAHGIVDRKSTDNAINDDTNTSLNAETATQTMSSSLPPANLDCINKVEAIVNDGDIIERGPRTSLTFRHIFKTS